MARMSTTGRPPSAHWRGVIGSRELVIEILDGAIASPRPIGLSGSVMLIGFVVLIANTEKGYRYETRRHRRHRAHRIKAGEQSESTGP